MYESQKKAEKNYRERNPERTSYLRTVNIVRRFVTPNPGTKNAEAIEWAKKDGRYYDDLKALKEAIEKLGI